MKLATVIVCTLAPTGAIATNNRGVRGLDHSAADGDCRPMKEKFETARDNVLSFEDSAILEHFCNGFDRQATIDFIEALDRSTLDTCQKELFSSILDNKSAILNFLSSKYTCEAELESELGLVHDDSNGRRLTQDTTLFDALAVASTEGGEGKKGKNGKHGEKGTKKNRKTKNFKISKNHPHRDEIEDCLNEPECQTEVCSKIDGVCLGGGICNQLESDPWFECECPDDLSVGADLTNCEAAKPGKSLKPPKTSKGNSNPRDKGEGQTTDDAARKERARNLAESWKQSERKLSDACDDWPGWVDSYGDGCEWYEAADDPGCPLTGMSYEPFDSNGNSLGLPREACCHCGGGFVLECETTPHNWKDSYGDGCEWYELYDEPGCPNYGEYYDGGMGKPNQACCYCEGGSIVSNPLPPSGTWPDSEELELLAFGLHQSVEVAEQLYKFESASHNQERVDACKAIQQTENAQEISEIAKATQTTISIGLGWGGTVMFSQGSFMAEFHFGEDGQFACGEAKSFGLNVALVDASSSIAITLSPKWLLGGWSTVSGEFSDGNICLSVAYSPPGISIGATAVVNPSVAAEAFADAIAEAIGDGDVTLSDFLDILKGMDSPPGVMAIGVEFGVEMGDPFSEAIEALGVPDVSLGMGCSSILSYCDDLDGDDICDDKAMVELLDNGELCSSNDVLGHLGTCDRCIDEATWWWGTTPIGFRCGVEPCWEDGTVCLAGTTCNKCCNEARQALGTKCGGSCWSDGTLCGAGTTCDFCCNSYEYWNSKAFTACGSEPCWSKGSHCGAGTTCNNCCNGYSYWWSKMFTCCD